VSLAEQQRTKSDSQVGYWTHDQIVEMDRNATLQMARYHSSHASPEIKAMLLKIKRRTEIPQFTPADTTRLLAELFADLPENDGNEDLHPAAVKRVYVETAKAIRKAVALRHGITVSDLDSDHRQKRLVLARQEAMYLVARDCPALSYPRMGRMFGGKDHTTVWHGIRKHADRNGLPRVREGVAV
jgi:hypothetical protein